MNDATCPSPILFNNEDDTVFIIDIPASITAAQCLPGQAHSSRALLSCAPLATPYPSTEPKSAAALARTQNHNDDSAVHSIYAALITEAQTEIRNTLSEQSCFCLPRHFAADVTGGQSGSSRKGKHKRKRGVDDGNNDHDRNAVVPTHTPAQQSVQPNEPIILENETSAPLPITFSSQIHASSPDDAAYTHTLPPHSTALLSHITPTTISTFRRTARSHSPDTYGRFDFILLDPPWPNRSVMRSSSYSTAPSLTSLTSLMLCMDLDIHISPGGWVAMWITNKAAVRAAALKMFDAWGVVLREEWVWCKVTTSGDPVSEVDGVWRKPYEVCLIGQRGDGAAAAWGEGQGEVKRRVLFGVPDLHSRKPCLKSLVERLLLKCTGKGKYVALEVFARYTVAGWMSWGDEAVKYNGREWRVDNTEDTIEKET